MSENLRTAVKPFASADHLVSLREVLTTLLGYGLFLWSIYFTYTNGWWWLYPICVLACGLFMVKVFAVQHDCSHGSFFNSPWLNLWVGRLMSLLTTMPFGAWKEEHDIHHSHVADIEQLSHGDILLLTVEEYKKLTPFQQVVYQVRRHPVFHLLIAPFIYFFLKSKFPAIMSRNSILSVFWTNVFVLLIYGGLVVYFGFWTTVMVFVPAAYLGGIVGIGLFYLQHDFPEAKWFNTSEWEHIDASLQGSSLIVLPQPLEWLTHSIGYHHIHHLNSKVPGYKLKEAYEEIPDFQTVKPLSWWDVREAFKLKLWSHEKGQLINFSDLATVTK
jgi:acyl-lipid omega-6 desaturase (Delta-12 desaturase)